MSDSAIAPTTEPQREIWSSAAMGHAASCTFNLSISIVFTGKLDAGALRGAIEALSARHEALRMTIEDTGLRFCIHPEVALDCRLIDCPTGADLDAIMREEMTTPFDLVHGPLWRTKIIKKSEDSSVLIATFHHIVCDGWSLSVVQRELRFLYGEIKLGRHIPPTIVSRFGSYAALMESQSRTNQYAQDESYWADIFSSGAPPIDIPTDFPRPLVRSYDASWVDLTITPEITSQLKIFSRASGASLYCFLFAVYCILIRRLSTSRDAVIGVPMAGQPLIGQNDLIGHCVNFIPVLQNVPLNMAFDVFLQTVSETLLDAQDHRLCTFGGLLQKLKIPRDPARIPLVSYCFTYIPLSEADVGAFFDLETSYIFNPNHFETFELNFDIIDVAGRLDFRCHYNKNLFTESTIRRFLGYFESILLAVSKNPSCILGKIPLLSPTELNQIMVDWNSTASDLPFEQTLPALFRQQVIASPEKMAVLYEDTALSYGELDTWSDSIAQTLAQHGAGPGKMVALCAERSIEMVAGLFGILKAGAAYVPLDPAYPSARMAAILKDANPPVILAGRSFISKITPLIAAPVISLEDTYPKAFGPQTAEFRQLTPATPRDPAYVIYTSGSTGAPKGVVIPHRGICNRLLWMQKEFVLTDKDRILQKTPYTFDVSVWEFFWPLITGASLVMARPGGHQDAAYIAETIQNSAISVVHFVPSMLGFFIEENSARNCETLRFVVCSGEALTHALQERFFERMPPACKLYNLYGPTEASVDVSYWECRRSDPRSIVPIGKPIANTQLYILNELMQPTPLGVSGELHIGGVGLAHGYLNRPDLTKEKFVPNPFSAKEDGAGNFLYKTGDAAKWLSDGAIEYVGRLDFQVKIRGFRIELGEIEECIGKVVGVIECSAIVLEESPGNKCLVAYVTVSPNAGLSAKNIRDFLHEHLPEYMVPSKVFFLDHLPQTSSGKIDRKALALRGDKSCAPEAAVIKPKNKTQQDIAEIWAQELNISSVSIADNFFDIGGHSLLLAKINNRLKAKFGQPLSMISMYQYPTIASLAEHIDKKNVPDDLTSQAAKRAQLQRGALKKSREK